MNDLIKKILCRDFHNCYIFVENELLFWGGLIVILVSLSFLAHVIFEKKCSISTVFLAILVLLCIFIIRLIIGYGDTFGSYFPVMANPSRADFGTMGDFFGGILNPLFSFLGLLMLLATLSLNQKELELSRKELKDSSSALKEQSETLKKQRFEDTFFSLLDQFNIISDKLNSPGVLNSKNMRVGNENGTIVAGILAELNTDGLNWGNYAPLLKGSKNKLLKHHPLINQYFRVLYQILKLIALKCPDSSHNSVLPLGNIFDAVASPEEKFYSNLIRSFVSEDMYFLLAINCYVENEDDDFYKYKLLIERFAFLEHLNLYNIKEYSQSLLYLISLNYRAMAFGKNRDYAKCFLSAQNHYRSSIDSGAIKIS